MEIDKAVGIVGEPSNIGAAIKAPTKGKDKGMGKRIVIRTVAYKSPFIPQCI